MTDPNLHPLSVELIQELWSKTYNTEGKPDWSHLFPYYHENILFRDSIQTIQGIESFKAMCQRLTERSQSLRMDLSNVTQNGNVFFMEWTMTLSFKKYPDSAVYGCTRLTLAEDGRIVEQRDYYDLWGDIFDNIPRFNKHYRNFMKKKFG